MLSLTCGSPKTPSTPFQFAIQAASGSDGPSVAMSRIVEAALPYTPATKPRACSSLTQAATNACTTFVHDAFVVE